MSSSGTSGGVIPNQKSTDDWGDTSKYRDGDDNFRLIGAIVTTPCCICGYFNMVDGWTCPDCFAGFCPDCTQERLQEFAGDAFRRCSHPSTGRSSSK